MVDVSQFLCKLIMRMTDIFNPTPLSLINIFNWSLIQTDPLTYIFNFILVDVLIVDQDSL